MPRVILDKACTMIMSHNGAKCTYPAGLVDAPQEFVDVWLQEGWCVLEGHVAPVEPTATYDPASLGLSDPDRGLSYGGTLPEEPAVEPDPKPKRRSRKET